MEIGNIAELGIAGMGMAIGLISLGVLIWYMKTNPKGGCSTIATPANVHKDGQAQQDIRIDDVRKSLERAHARLDDQVKVCSITHQDVSAKLATLIADVSWMKSNWPKLGD
jgi:hypothetical protein